MLSLIHILQFDGVDSFFYLWINGQYVGFSKDSRNPARFDISPYLKKGETTYNYLLFQSESYNNKSPLFHHYI